MGKHGESVPLSEREIAARHFGCDCSIITPRFIDDLVASIWAAEGDGAMNTDYAELLQDAVEVLGAQCGVIKDEEKVVRPYEYEPEYGPKAPMPTYTLAGKKYKLVGTEAKLKTAFDWAARMKEHGEKIKILPSKDGFALYREE